jgi:hypothetical protein
MWKRTVTWKRTLLISAGALATLVRRAGLDAVRAHWPGTDDGFTALTRLTGITARDGRV